jgi:hypothetical protein
MNSEVAIEPPSHCPHVSEPETSSPTAAPAWIATSSNTVAKAAVRNTSSKWFRTSSLLRFKAATGPRCSLLITGANNDQRVSTHKPGTTSRVVATLGIMIAAIEAPNADGTIGDAYRSLCSIPSIVMRLASRSASAVTSSAYAT